MNNVRPSAPPSAHAKQPASTSICWRTSPPSRTRTQRLFAPSPSHAAFGAQRGFAPSESHATISRAPQSAIHRRPSYHRGDSPNTRGARVGVRRGPTAEALANADGAAASVRRSESNEELYAALRAGEIDAVVDDSPIAQYFSTVVEGLHTCGGVAS